MYASINTVILNHALRHPEHPALIENNTSISYGELAGQIPLFIKELQRQKLSHHAVVAIEWTDLHTHLLWSIACEALRYTSLCFSVYQEEISTSVHADLIIFTQDHKILTKMQSIITPASILDNSPSTCIARYSLNNLDLNQPIRIFETSGTTGTAKLIVRAARQHRFRHQQSCERMGYNVKTRYLLSHDFRLQEAYSSTMSVLREGGTCIYDARRPQYDAIEIYNATHISFVLVGLVNTLKKLPDHFKKRDNLCVHVTGGRVTSGLRAQVRKRLSDDLIESYGTNEAGIVARVDEEGVGHILANVEVEVVDKDNNPLAFGALGQLRIRSEACVESYLSNPSATSKHFQDGWFYPGDMASLVDISSFKIAGRFDNIMNIDGIKYVPEPIEEGLKQENCIKDICISSVQSDRGHCVIYICVILKNTPSDTVLNSILKKHLPPHWQTVKIVKMDQFPKTETGKVRRNRVLELATSIKSKQ